EAVRTAESLTGNQRALQQFVGAIVVASLAVEVAEVVQQPGIQQALRLLDRVEDRKGALHQFFRLFDIARLEAQVREGPEIPDVPQMVGSKLFFEHLIRLARERVGLRPLAEARVQNRQTGPHNRIEGILGTNGRVEYGQHALKQQFG